MTWKVAQDMTREIAQSLQEGRKLVRSVENLSLSLEPLAEDDTLQQLERVTEISREQVALLSGLYNSIARSAFGPGSAKREDRTGG
jgi:hypothetical protein